MHLLYVPNMVIWLFYDIDNLLVGKLEEREREETKTQNMKYLDISLLRIIMQVHELDQVLGLAYHANQAQADTSCSSVWALLMTRVQRTVLTLVPGHLSTGAWQIINVVTWAVTSNLLFL